MYGLKFSMSILQISTEACYKDQIHGGWGSVCSATHKLKVQRIRYAVSYNTTRIPHLFPTHI